jgi:probable HAF family extracellular repeat protein
MKWKLSALLLAAYLFTSLVFPYRALAQEHNQNEGKWNHGTKHQRYKLIDLGTFEGANSQFATAPTAAVVNNRGVAAGAADTTTANPFSSNDNPYLFADQFVEHAFKWDNGALIDLGALPNGASSFADWVNKSGEIAGFSENGLVDSISGYPEINAVVWKNGKIKNLGTLGGNHSLANALNDRGQVVGAALNATPDDFSFLGFGTQTRAFLWEEGVMRDLHTLGGADSFAFFINNRGQVAGFSSTNAIVVQATGLPTVEPFLWEHGHMIDLGGLGGNLGQPLALNSRGEVVGFSDLPGDLTNHPFLWDGKNLIDLQTLGGANGMALSLNDAGDVVGEADVTDSQTHHAFLWKDGQIQDLETVDGDACSTANSINSQGQIVGDSGDCNTPGHAFLWENDGPMVDLNALISGKPALLVTSGLFINDHGEIACLGRLLNGNQHACLLKPLEEDEHAANTTLDSAAQTNLGTTTNAEQKAKAIAGAPKKPRAGLRMAQWLLAHKSGIAH